MGFELYAYQFSRLNHDVPGSGITEWENSSVRAEVLCSDIFLEAFGHLFRDIDRFRLLSAFGIIQNDFLILNVASPDFKYLTDSHAATGHQLQHQSVTLTPGSEYHLIDLVLFEDVPSMDLGLSEYFSQDAGIAGIGDVFVGGVSEEIEKGFEQRVAEFLGGLPGSLTEPVQENHDFIGCDGFKLPVAKFPVENGKQNFIVFSGAFFLNLPDGIPGNNGRRNGLS